MLLLHNNQTISNGQKKIEQKSFCGKKVQRNVSRQNFLSLRFNSNYFYHILFFNSQVVLIELWNYQCCGTAVFNFYHMYLWSKSGIQTKDHGNQLKTVRLVCWLYRPHCHSAMGSSSLFLFSSSNTNPETRIQPGSSKIVRVWIYSKEVLHWCAS